MEAVFGSVGGGSEGEVGVKEAVHEAGGDGVEGVGEAENVDGCAVVHGLESEAGEVPDVVVVPMGEEDGLESVLFMVGEAGHETASVDGEYVVDEEAGMSGTGRLQVVGAEDADFHILPLSRGRSTYDSGLEGWVLHDGAVF